MAEKFSRRKIAHFVADHIEKGEALKPIIDEIAAYLVETKQEREAELLVMAIEQELANRGIVLANITSAHPLSVETKREIKQFIDSKKLYVREQIDPELIGGLVIDLPGKRFDSSVRRKLATLKNLGNIRK